MNDFFVDRPILATVLALVITLVGSIALTQLPIARYPQITPPTVVVNATFPGADARTIEQSVAAPIEQQVNGASNMLYMSSKSANDGTYSLTVTFDVGTNQDLAAVEVQNRVAAAQRFLPQDVTRQGVTISKRQPQVLMVVALRATDPRYDYLFLSNYATLNVYDALARIPGVGNVTVFGVRDYGMRIWLDPARMAKLGITTQDVNAAVGEQNVVAPAGRVGAEPAPLGQQMQYSINVRGRLTSVSEYENIVLRSGDEGALVRLRDVARVELAATDYSRSSRLMGEPVASIGVYQLPDANALDVARAVRKAMENLSTRFPSGIDYTIPFDTTAFVSESLYEVQHTLVIATLLVLAVVFLFLESWRATLIPMLAVPVSLIGTFTAFAMLGFSINTLTLLALVLAIGLVVDDAIVVVEAVMEKIDRHGLSARDATRAALQEVRAPVIAIALVLTAVFAPVAFLTGLTGQFYRQFALTLSISVLISALVALSFTPALCVLLLRPTAESESDTWLGRLFRRFHQGFDRLTESYSNVVRGLIRRAGRVSLIFALLIGATYALVHMRPGGFLPEEDQGYLLFVGQLPPGASQQRTDEVMKRFSALVMQQPEVENLQAITGLNLLSGVTTSYIGSGFIVLKPWRERGTGQSAQALLMRLMAAAGKQIPEANFMLINPPSVPGIGQAGGFEFVLQDRGGGDLDRFIAVMRDTLAQASQRPEIARLFTQFNPAVPQIEYVVDRERAKTLGVSLSDLFSTLQTFLGGSYINDFNLFGRTYRVTAQAEADARATPEAVNNLYVRNGQGEMTPLSTLVTVKPREGPEYIERFNVFRAITLSGSTAPGYSSGDAIRAMEQIGAQLPEGYGFEWAGVAYQEKKSSGQAPWLFAMAMLFVFLVLAAQYESWSVPFAVLLGIPFAVLGAFAGLALRGMNNDIYAQVGLIMLIGLAAKNAILIVEYARLAHQRGASVVEAAVAGARLRLRPILMTSFAFILGTLPLALASGAGAAARQVLGTTVVFGMTIATLLGIFIIPMFYVLIQQLAERRRGLVSGRHGV